MTAVRTCRAMLVLAAVIAATGCAVVRSHEARDAEDVLVAAGFRSIPSDTPARADELGAMPPLRMVRESVAGHVVYRHADPYNCDCLFGARVVGT